MENTIILKEIQDFRVKVFSAIVWSNNFNGEGELSANYMIKNWKYIVHITLMPYGI
jgi:hypothetical protein